MRSAKSRSPEWPSCGRGPAPSTWPHSRRRAPTVVEPESDPAQKRVQCASAEPSVAPDAYGCRAAVAQHALELGGQRAQAIVEGPVEGGLSLALRGTGRGGRGRLVRCELARFDDASAADQEKARVFAGGLSKDDGAVVKQAEPARALEDPAGVR